MALPLHGTRLDELETHQISIFQLQLKQIRMSTHYNNSRTSLRPQLLKVPDVAALLSLKPRTIYEMVAQGRIPYRKPPGSNILRFDLEEIVAWTKAGSSRRNGTK